jgi:hypothetical protein
MPKKTEIKEQVTEQELDGICRKVAQWLHEGLREEFQPEVKEITIARAVKSILTDTDQVTQMLEDAMDEVAEGLCKHGSVNVRFTKFKLAFFGREQFLLPLTADNIELHLGAYSGENPLTSEVPYTLEQAIVCDLFNAIRLFFEEHHIEEDIVEGDGGFRLVDAEPAEAPNGEKVN